MIRIQWLSDLAYGRKMRLYERDNDVVAVMVNRKLLTHVNGLPKLCLVWIKPVNGKLSMAVEPYSVDQLAADPDVLERVAHIVYDYNYRLAEMLMEYVDDVQRPNMRGI